MKKLVLLVSMALIGGLHAGALTESTSPMAASLPIAYVDLRLILSENFAESANEWRDRMMVLQQEIEVRMTKNNADVEKFQREYSDLRSKKGAMMSDAARNAKMEELAKLEKDIKIAEESARSYYSQISQQIYADMIGKIEKVVKELAAARNYLVVLAGPVLYVSTAIDITKDVISELNKRYKPKKEVSKAETKPALAAA